MSPENSFSRELARDLEKSSQANLRRSLCQLDTPQRVEVIVEGRRFLNFSSNDYLGLCHHPALAEAGAIALKQFGAGSGASRLISGSLAPHQRLEEALADFMQTEAALVFSSGYGAALGVLSSLLEPHDILVIDKLCHASIIDAARLAQARLRVFKHNDLADLEKKLAWAKEQRAKAADTRILIATESVFSMDGDLAPLQEILSLKRRFGAWLILDEAHAIGIYGERGGGLAEAIGCADQVEIRLGTLGKSLGVAGGFAAGSSLFREYLINRARSFIYSTAPAPVISAMATAALQLLQSDEGKILRANLARNIQTLCRLLQIPAPALGHSAIFPWLLGDEIRALQSTKALAEAGFWIPAIRYPTVPKGKARLRITLSADHSAQHLHLLAAALQPPAP